MKRRLLKYAVYTTIDKTSPFASRNAKSQAGLHDDKSGINYHLLFRPVFLFFYKN
jgi:hypothetical protein